jgi:hypothetical protein
MKEEEVVVVVAVVVGKGMVVMEGDLKEVT